MSSLKQIFMLVAVVAIMAFAPQLSPLIGQFLGVSSFIASVIGSVVIAAALTGIQMLLNSSSRGVSQDAGKVNVRIAEPPRWTCAGEVRQGGGVMFAEFDGAGNFWYIVVHGDSILTDLMTPQHYLDDLPVTLNGSNEVQEADFRLKSNKEKDPATSSGDGNPYVWIWTTTYSEVDPVPPGIAQLTAACPQWTADEHLLVGTTYSVVKMAALTIEHRFKIYKWRGPIGLGEPAVSVAGVWSNVYDPRDETQTLGDRSTYKPTRNAALIWAWFRTHRYGRRKPESSINWDMISEQADICDQSVVGVESTQARYECGIAIPENKQRAVAEQEIMLTMDGQIVFDEDGKTWVRAGAWYVPTLTFHRNRDIVAMQSIEAQNGESETQGVIVRYTAKDAKYSPQPSAAWLNPNYYVDGETPQLLTVDILGCNNHNQAMRLAKSIGMRSQPLHKCGPTISLRGLRARQERIINLNYDNTFAGDYEIVTPVEVDAVGIFCGMGLVPVDENRWTLLEGEELGKPVLTGPGDGPTYPALGAVLSEVDGQLLLTFDPLPRPDARYIAEYIQTSDIAPDDDDPWLPMVVNGETAISGFVEGGVEYTVRYRYVTGSGNGPDWAELTIEPEGQLIEYDGGDEDGWGP